MRRAFASVALLLALLVLGAVPASAAWVPPIGIPAPSFGVDDAAPVSASYCTAWPASEDPNCYYVDPNFTGATDTPSTRHGTPNVPRRTVPTTLASSGSTILVEVWCSGSCVTPIAISGTVNWSMTGTSSAPIYIKGIGNPIFDGTQSQISLYGSYAIVEGNHFSDIRFRFGRSGVGDADHIVIRNNEIEGWTGTAQTSVIGSNTPVTLGPQHIVIYANTIHDNSFGGDIDVHGVLVGCAGWSQVWYVDNHSYKNEGDSIQVGAASNCTLHSTFVYIARNTMHEDGENCVDIKIADDIFISQNYCWGYVPSGAPQSSAGEAVVVHNGSVRVWVIFNKIENSTIGIIGTGQADFYIIGNVLTNIFCQPSQSCTYTTPARPGNAIDVDAETTAAWVVANTIRDSDRGINCETAGGSCHVINNVIATLKQDSHGIAFESSTVHTNSTVANNLFFMTAGNTRVQVTSTRYASVTAYRGAHTSKCTTSGSSNCPEGDPLFVNETSNADLSLTASSPAKDTGTADPGPYATFSSTYGLSIDKDFAGTARPQGVAWDIGGYEYTASSGAAGRRSKGRSNAAIK